MINIADLPAVRAQLERDVMGTEAIAVPVIPQDVPHAQQPPVQSAYPSKRMVFKDGQYQVADHEK